MLGKRILLPCGLALALLVLFSPLPTAASHRLLTLYGAQLTPTKQFSFMSGSVDPSITFTRAGTTASQYNSAGTLVTGIAANTPREDYNPATLALNGLLIEQAVTNNLTYSNDLSQATAWNTNGSPTIAANAVVSPDGTSDATQLACGASVASGTWRLPATVNGNTYTQTIDLKLISGTSTGLKIGWDSANGYLIINPQTMTITTTASAVTHTAPPQSLGNGWYRFQWSFVATGSSVTFVIYNNTTSTVTLGVYDVEQQNASFATSPIITTSAGATRNIDSAIISNPSWFTGSGATLLVKIVVPAINTSRNTTLASFNDGTANNQIKIILTTAGVPEAQIFVGGTAKTSGGSLAAVSPGSVIQAAVSYQSGSNSFAVNGVTDGAGTLTTASLPTGLSQLTIGDDGAGAQTLNGWVQAIKYWNSSKSPSQVTSVEADVIDALGTTNQINNLN